MATLCIHTWSQQLGDQTVKHVGVRNEFDVTNNEEAKEKWDDVIDNVKEKFLDDVFGVNSKITRKEFITQTQSK